MASKNSNSLNLNPTERKELKDKFHAELKKKGITVGEQLAAKVLKAAIGNETKAGEGKGAVQLSLSIKRTKGGGTSALIATKNPSNNKKLHKKPGVGTVSGTVAVTFIAPPPPVRKPPPH